VVNVDLASTSVQLAGVRPGLPQDGRSLVPLLEGASPPTPRQTVFIAECFGHEYAPPGLPKVEAVRADRYLYVEYQNGWRDEPWDLERPTFVCPAVT